MRYILLVILGIGVISSVVGEIQGECWHPLTTGIALLAAMVWYYIAAFLKEDI